MRTLFLDIKHPIESRLLDPSTSDDLGGAAKTIHKKLQKPIREFSLEPWDQLLRDQMEVIRNEVHAGRITGVFWLDGDQYGDITEPIFIADGNGVQTEFPMPFDNIFAPSWIIYEDGVAITNWTMKEESGILVCGTAPSGRLTGIGKRKFRVIFRDSSESILSETQLYSSDTDGVYALQNPITLLEVEATNIV
jgi:hypothetical protein